MSLWTPRKKCHPEIMTGGWRVHDTDFCVQGGEGELVFPASGGGGGTLAHVLPEH